MNKITLALAAGVTLTSAAVAQAEAFKAGDILVRARVVQLDAANKNSDLPVSINDKTIPEVNLSYFFNPNVAAELVLTVPQRHDVFLGADRIGSLKHLPPTLTLQYHFPMAGMKPYVGAGINFTRFSSVNLPGLSVEKNSWGGALQAGVDFPIGKNMVFNVDVKKVFIETDIRNAAGAVINTHKVDPLLFGVGLGWKF